MTIVERDIHWVFIITGFGSFALAAYLALSSHTELPGTNTNTAPKIEPHPASWGAAEGFAVAGGLCFLAAGLVVRSGEPVK